VTRFILKYFKLAISMSVRPAQSHQAVFKVWHFYPQFWHAYYGLGGAQPVNNQFAKLDSQ
jgi:hypothetical protein